MTTLKEMEASDGVQRFISSCESRNLSRDTILFYSATLKPFASAFSMLPIEPEPIEEYLGSLNGSLETRYARFNTLRIFYKFLNERYEFPDPNPMIKIKAPRKQRAVIPSLNDEEITKALKATTSLRDYALLRLFLDNGIRLAEAATLQQVNVGERTIKVTGKEGEEEVPISPDVRDLLRQLGPGPVFKAYDIQQFSKSGMGTLIRRILTRAEVSTRKKGPHILRHTFARVFLMSGGDAISLKNILRHSTLTMTERYVHLWGSDIYTKHQQYSPSRLITVKPPEQRRGRGRPRKVSPES